MLDNYLIPNEYLGGKREEELTEDEYYMNIAYAASLRSVDPSTRVGACYVNGKNICVGYNRPPANWNADEFPWLYKGDITHYQKYPYVIHAEMDGLSKDFDFEGSTCYVTLFPCSNCAKHMVDRGVKRVVYKDIRLNEYTKEDVKAVLYMFNMCGVDVQSFKSVSTVDTISLDYNKKENEIVKIRKRSLEKDSQ